MIVLHDREDMHTVPNFCFFYFYMRYSMHYCPKYKKSLIIRTDSSLRFGWCLKRLTRTTWFFITIVHRPMLGRAIHYSRSKLLSRNLHFHDILKRCQPAALPWQQSSIRSFGKRSSVLDETTVFEDKDEKYEPEEITSVDRLFRFHPLKEEDGDDTFEDEFEGRPDTRKEENEFLEDGDVDPRHKLGKAILSLGKIHYRHAEKLPEWFLERQDEICQYRTNPQIRRCLKDWMVKHDRDLLEKYRNKSLQWGHKLSSKEKPTEIRAYGPEETIAYSFYYMPGRYGLLHRVFTELSNIAPDFAPKRIMDFGCGPATAAAAAYEIWGAKAEKYTGVDISQSMVDAAKIMTRSTIRDCAFYTSNSEIMKRMLNTGERFDLVVASYTLSELPNDPSKRIATQMLFETLDVGGYMIILEPGNPYGSHNTRTARQFVLDTFNNVNKSGKTNKAADAASTFFKPKHHAGGKGGKKFDSRFQEGGVDFEDEEGDEGSDEEERGGRRGLGQEKNYLHKKDFIDKERMKNGDQDKEYQEVTMMLPPPKNGDYTYEELGAYVVAPCSHDKPCPLKASMWCSFSQKVYSGIIRKSSEEKFSYVIIQKRPKVSPPSSLEQVKRNLAAIDKATAAAAVRAGQSSPTQKDKELIAEAMLGKKTADLDSTRAQWAEQVTKYARGSTHKGDENKWGSWVEPVAIEPASRGEGGAKSSHVATPLEILERFMVADERQVPKLVDQLVDEIDWEEYKPPLHREEWGRIIRSPIKNKKHVTMDVCTPNGYVQRSTISKANLIHIPSLYTALRKTTWGGLYPVLTSDEGSRNALARTAKGTRLRSEADDVSVHPANYVTSSLDPTYREDSGKSAQRGGGGGVAGVGLKARAGKTGGSPQQQQGGGGSRKDRNASPSRTVDRFDEDDDGSPRRGGERSSRSSGGGGGGKVRMEEITASAGSAQYRKIQMAQAFGKEAAQKGKSFGGANNNNISGGGGSAGGAPAAPKTGLAGQLERMKRRREEKAREQQQQKKKDSEAV